MMPCQGFLILFLVGVGVTVNVNGYGYKTKYFDVRLDHFNYVSPQTFKLKYLVNDTFWNQEEGAPIFFYCGNEGTIESFAENLGFIYESAERFHALVLLAEHRYYGESLPFGMESLSHPNTSGYLSVEQALADFVDVIQLIQDESQAKLGARFQRHPVIAFGGSYGGMLAFYLRMKYPHMVQGALASSAPLFQMNDMAPCDIFYKAVTKIYRDVSPTCEENIRGIWNMINLKLQTDIGRVTFSQEWNLCSLVQTQVDVAAFKNWLRDLITTMAMTNYPYPTNFLAPLPGDPVKKFCAEFDSHLTAAASGNGTDILSALRVATDVYTQHGLDRRVCLDVGAKSPLTVPGWHFQTCTELVFPFCASEETMYEPYAWDNTAWADACQATFGVRPDTNHMRKMFGDRRIEFTSNVIFSNGLKDPWSAGGVLQSLSPSLIAILIPDAAHHLDLRGANPQDPASVVQARQQYEDYFRQWIAEFQADLDREATFI